MIRGGEDRGGTGGFFLATSALSMFSFSNNLRNLAVSPLPGRYRRALRAFDVFLTVFTALIRLFFVASLGTLCFGCFGAMFAVLVGART
jgi:hypothetical protein